MAVAFRNATTASNAAGTANLTVNVPAGTVNGDVLLLCGNNSNPDTYTTPSGWTPLDAPAIAAVGQSALFYRIASSEPASYVLTKASASLPSTAVMLSYSGASGTIRDHTSANTANGVTTGTPTALSGVTASDMAVHFYGADDSATNTTNIVLTPPGGSWNTRANVSVAKGGVSRWGSAIAAIDQLGSSATPNTTSNNSCGWPICSVALIATGQTVSPTGIASGEAFGTPTVVLGPPPPPASGPLRRFDPIEKVVRDARREQADNSSTVLARLGSHTHSYLPLSTVTTKGDLLVATASGTIVRQGVGSNNQLLIADSTQTTGIRWDTTLASLTVTGTVITDSAWNSFTFSNSWTDNTFARYRMMPDGTVMFRGIITKATNPTGGEIVITGLPAAYRPAQRANFLCACGSRVYNGTQKIEVETDGTCKIWDMAAASGDVCLDSIRYPVI